MSERRELLAYPDPPLSDGVVRLRPWGELDPGADAEALAAAWADPAIRRWLPVPTEPELTVAAARWISATADLLAGGVSLDLVVARVGAGSVGVLGEVGLGPIDWPSRQARIGYWIAAPHRGQGLATRAAGLLAGFAVRELGLDVVAEIDPANGASVVVAERANLRWRPAARVPF